MTDKLTKTFFDTFGIKPKELIYRTMNCACGCHDCENCDKYKNNYSKKYPQITDTHYLELICIIQQLKDVDCLKEFVLKHITDLYKTNCESVSNTNEYQQTARDIKQQVQLLFKETK